MPRPNLLPFQDRVRVVTIDDTFSWLAAGWRDYKAAGWISIVYGLNFVLLGFLLTVGLAAAGFGYLIAPLIEAFLLVGPLSTIGFYVISRDLERGEKPTLGRILAAWRLNTAQVLAMGLGLVLILIIWLRIAVLIFAISFPYIPLDLKSMINVLFFTTDGYICLTVGSAFGALFAGVVFITAVTAMPMMIDRKVGLVEAVVTSIVSVLTNFRTMLFWAATIVVVTAAGLLSGYIGLAVTLPLIGHASWHAYRGLIRPIEA